MNQKRPSSPSAEAQRIRRVLQQRRQKRRRYWLLIALELILIVVLLVVFVARNVSREPTDGTQTSANSNGEVLQTSVTEKRRKRMMRCKNRQKRRYRK